MGAAPSQAGTLHAVDLQKSSYRSVEVAPSQSLYDPAACYSFVGSGHGKYEKVQEISVTSWKLKKEWAYALIVFALVAFAALGALLVNYVPFSMGGAIGVAPKQPDAVSRSQEAAVSARKHALLAPLRSATVLDQKNLARRPVVPVLTREPMAYPAGVQASVAQPFPYNCLDGLSDAHRSWTQEKQDWCCTHQHRGCPVALYDCNIDRSYGLAITWPVAKRQWCCSARKVGCPPTTTATTTSSTVTTVTATSTTETQTTYGFQCQGSTRSWPLPQKVWCCTRTGKGCVSSGGIDDSSKNIEREVWAAVDKADRIQAKIRQDKTSQQPSPVPWAQDAKFDCDDGREETWSTEHELWCYWQWQVQGKAESAATLKSPLR